MVKTDGEFATIFTCFWHLFSQKEGESLPPLSFTSSTRVQTTGGEGKHSSAKKGGTAAYDGVAFKS